MDLRRTKGDFQGNLHLFIDTCFIYTGQTGLLFYSRNLLLAKVVLQNFGLVMFCSKAPSQKRFCEELTVYRAKRRMLTETFESSPLGERVASRFCRNP